MTSKMEYTNEQRLKMIEDALGIDKTNPHQQKPEPAKIAGAADFWRINNVFYRNVNCTIDLAKVLLDNGSSKTQSKWIEYSRQAKAKGDFYVGDMPLYHAVFTALSKTQSKDAEEAKEFIRSQMRSKWLMTLTRIKYMPKEKDEAIHNFGMDDEYTLKGVIVGQNGFIESGDSDCLEALLGTGNISEINKVYQWLNGTNVHIWRLNSKPKNIDERVAGFNAYSGRADHDCDEVPGYSVSSLGVRKVAPLGVSK